MLSKKAVSLFASPTQAIDAKAKKMVTEGLDVVNYGAGEPDFDTPEHIRNAAIEALNQGFTRYTPSSGVLELREAICAKLLKDNGLKYDPSQVIVSNGAKHSLSNIFATLLDEGRYLCSIRTMYRLLAANAEVRERRNQARHPAYAKPELLATGPNQV